MINSNCKTFGITFAVLGSKFSKYESIIMKLTPIYAG